MRWKQFFKPVKSIDAVEARQYIQRMAGDAFTPWMCASPANMMPNTFPERN